MNRPHPKSWQECSPGVAEKTGPFPSSDTSLSLCARNQGVCGHKRRQAVAEALKGVYTGVK